MKWLVLLAGVILLAIGTLGGHRTAHDKNPSDNLFLFSVGLACTGIILIAATLFMKY